MTNTIEQEFTTRRDAREAEPRRRRSRPLIAFALAALAVGGIGAAATSAAWTDNTLFAAQAEAATFNLQGSLDGKTWVESDGSGAIQLTVPASELADLLPGQSRTIDLSVRNLGSVSAALTSSVEWKDAGFATNPTVAVKDLSDSLTPADGDAASDTFQLVVSAPDDWASVNQGKSGTIVVTIAATATA